MKKITILLLLLAHAATAQIKPKSPVADIYFNTLLNAPKRNVHLNELSGKVVLLEFWATWCGSCLEAMPHLIALQQQYKGKLQVITVTDESAARIGRYLHAKPSNLWFAIDTARTIAKAFPHQLIPHSVLIDTEGRLVANIAPDDLTGEIIDNLLAKRPIVLKEKKDHITTSTEELISSVFPAADTIRSRFLMQPKIEGAPGFSQSYNADSIWNGRRISAINVNLLTLYRIAYGEFSYSRVIDETGTASQSQSYCLDLIVDKPEALFTVFKEALASRFEIKARLTNLPNKVTALTIENPKRFSKLKLNSNGIRTYYARHGEIDQQAITMADFADYLESFGIVNGIVVDETHASDKYDIKFSFEPENPSSLFKVLKDMGLKLTETERVVQLLTLQ